MEITFDASKNETNRAKHGFDFGDLTVEFFRDATIVPANEGRLMAIGHSGNASRLSQGKEPAMTPTRKPVPDLTDEEEARIQRQIADDPDAPEATDEQLARAQSFAEALPELAAAIKRGRGRPRLDETKEQVTLRLSPEVLRYFRADGAGWQSRIDEALVNFARSGRRQ
jgi:uncharacterized protein (DUF4415 family)